MNTVRAHRRPQPLEAVQWAGNVTAAEIIEWAGNYKPGKPWFVARNHGLILWVPGFSYNPNFGEWVTVPVGSWLLKDLETGEMTYVEAGSFASDFEVEDNLE